MGWKDIQQHSHRAKYGQGGISFPTDSQLPTVKWTGFLLYGPWVEDMQHQNLTTAFMLKTQDGNKMKWPLTLERMGWNPKRKIYVRARTAKRFVQFHSFAWEQLFYARGLLEGRFTW